ncbi:nucleotidyltransferase domain-containing protein [Candidatus Woesearchaeota archaeon]|nr:nucleotidyltransferase domain-containing protein [Candidatus Woesearchaeota archaeon]
MLNILKKPEIRKIFGKKELGIIRKQLNGLNLTQSEKNRLSRDIRPKFKAINLLSQQKEYFELKKNRLNKAIINESVNIIMKDTLSQEISAILLFGSQIDKTHTLRSDIDICIVFKKQLSLKELTLFRKRVLGKLNSRVDIQIFNLLPLNIKKTLSDKNKILFKNKQFKQDIFISTTWKKYFEHKSHIKNYFNEAKK